MSDNKDKLHLDRILMIGEMSAGIIHDINNPLTIAMASIELGKMDLDELIEEGLKNDIDSYNKIKALKKYLTNIEMSLSRIAQISESVRVLSYNGSTDFQEIELTQLLTDVNSFCNNFLRKNDIELTINNKNPIMISGNRTMLSQLFINLIKNAADAIANLPCFNKWIEISCLDDESNIIVKIVDGGSGIPPEICEKIFDPFFTTKELGSGTGLGLGLCLQIINHHHGAISVDKNAKNTTFVITIPKIIG